MLYNYPNIEKLIDKRKQELIDEIDVRSYACNEFKTAIKTSKEVAKQIAKASKEKVKATIGAIKCLIKATEALIELLKNNRIRFSVQSKIRKEK